MAEDVTLNERELFEVAATALAEAVRTQVLPPLRKEVQALVEEALRASPEWVSLHGDGPGDEEFGATLRQHFGLADPTTVLGAVLEALKNSIVGGLGSRRRTARPSWARCRSSCCRLTTVTSWPCLAPATTPTVMPSSGLRWLLFEGTNVVLMDAEKVTTINTKRNWQKGSRAGGAIMQRRTREFRGKARWSANWLPGGRTPSPIVPWHVPEEWAGRAGDNWLVRAIAPVQRRIEEIAARRLAAL
jgi:hypothetical protein